MKCADIMKSDPKDCLTNHDEAVTTISSAWSCDFCTSCDVIFRTEELMETSIQLIGKRQISRMQVTNRENHHIGIIQDDLMECAEK
jgi:hypothetical protein